MSLKSILTTGTILCLAACQPRPPTVTRTSEGTAGLAPETVVARIDGQTVTAAELDSRVKGPLVRAEIEYREKVHELRSEGLEELVDQRLVERQAKKEGLTADALLEREVNAGLSEPGEDELRSLYEQATQAGQRLPPFEMIRDEVAEFVKNRQRKERADAYHEKLRADAKVELLMPALVLPRVEVDSSGPSLGAADAPVTIVAFSDYECPYCQKADPAVKEVLQAYKGKVRLVYKEFPLPNHPNAQKASEAALCAHEQGKYWEMHDKLFANQTALEVEALKGYARDLALDTARFDLCLDSDAKRADVRAGLKAGEAAGVTGTPAFFVNGRLISGAVPFERFKELIDAELAGSGKL
jgi:predicted DsbA family dithiol-disulfide isomerase